MTRKKTGAAGKENIIKEKPDGRFKDKVIIVTGGTQGLGEGIAKYLAGLGAGGIVICGRNQENGSRVEKELKDIGTESYYVNADLVVEEDCRNVVRACDRHFNRVNGLVNAAGITLRGNLEKTTVALWDQIFAINARAPFILMQEAARIMRREKRGGSIVNIVSNCSRAGLPSIMAYSASKGALATLTKNVAQDVQPDHIRVNGINMGWTLTDAEETIQRALGRPENWLELVEPQLPFKRLIRPIDVAKIVAYLLSDDSEMMTGSVIDFDQYVIGIPGYIPE